MTLEMSCHMAGHREFIIQDANADTLRVESEAQMGTYSVFVREWNPETWALGTLHEVQIKKTMRCD